MPSSVAARRRRTNPTPIRSVVIRSTKAWLERAVIGLNLCPFARSVYSRKLVRYRVTSVRSTSALIKVLTAEMRWLEATDPIRCETTLLIHPYVLSDFGDYNQFLAEADQLLHRKNLSGVFQIASFHPDYRFAGTKMNDITNFTNRSPYPILQLLREASVERAIAGTDEAARIVSRNLATMRSLGLKGWRKL